MPYMANQFYFNVLIPCGYIHIILNRTRYEFLLISSNYFQLLVSPTHLLTGVRRGSCLPPTKNFKVLEDFLHLRSNTRYGVKENKCMDWHNLQFYVSKTISIWSNIDLLDWHNLQVGEPETEIDQLYSQFGQKGEIE